VPRNGRSPRLIEAFAAAARGPHGRHVWRFQMLDLILLALGLALFAVSVGYAYACERL
jgi:hypothetical protein